VGDADRTPDHKKRRRHRPDWRAASAAVNTVSAGGSPRDRSAGRSAQRNRAEKINGGRQASARARASRPDAPSCAS
jgi:hypothetical protein